MYKVLVDGALLCDSRINELAIISPVVKLQANAAGSFSFTIAAEHPKRNLITRRKAIISVYIDDETEPVFQGIAVDETTDFYNQTTFTCEGELTYLNDSIQRQAYYSTISATRLLESYLSSHNSQVEEAKRFELGMVEFSDSITCFTNMNSTMTEIKEDLIDDLGGYLRVRYADGKKYLDYLKTSPYTNNQTIRLGENLVDYESNIDSTEIATSIIPLGAKLESQTVEGLDAYTDIKSVNDNKDYVYSEDAVKTYGWITQVVNWDDVTEPANLLTKANKYLAETQFENVVLKISAIDFGLLVDGTDRFNILDQIRVVSKPHGMDKYFMLTEQTLNLNEPEKDTVVLGSTEKLSLTAQTNSANSEILKRIEKVPTSTMVEAAIKNATQLITGSKGGYVKFKMNDDGQPEQILIMDNEDETLATRIWRWNEAGLGYGTINEETGKLEYKLAMTKDGEFLAGNITCKGLEVGTNVTMGADATISWEQVTDTDGVVTDDNKTTKIGKDYIDTLSVVAGSVEAENLTGTWIKGKHYVAGGKKEARWWGSLDSCHVVFTGIETNTDYSFADGAIQANGKMGCTGDFLCGGTKTRIVETEDYDSRLLYCYETPSPMFGDIGEGTIDDLGECYVFLDDIFAETIDTDVTYQVFLQKYGEGDCWVSERNSSYFVVNGTAGLSFGWEMKAIQNGYDNVRLEIGAFPTEEENLNSATDLDSLLDELIEEESTDE